MNIAMEYIEENLTGDIDYREAAKLACCSEYHFRRMFSFIAGVSLSEHIRMRRLTLAAFDLQDGKATVSEVASTYGYRSPDAFARAFRSHHGINPSEAKESRSPLKTWPRMTFHLTIKGGAEMDYRIEKKPSFRITGIKKRVPIQFEGINPEIESMWQSLSEQDIRELKELSDMNPAGIIQASTNFDEGRMEEKGELDHYIGVAASGEIPEKWDILEVAATAWAVFDATGPFPETVQDIWGRIYSEWFPSVRYEVTEGPEILSIKDKDTSLPQVKSEIWIPVKKV
jgi:AraC family transcriptional regulator